MEILKNHINLDPIGHLWDILGRHNGCQDTTKFADYKGNGIKFTRTLYKTSFSGDGVCT